MDLSLSELRELVMDREAWRAALGKQWKQRQTLFFWAPKSLQMVIAAMKLKDAYSLKGGEPGGLPSMGSHRVRHD